MESDSDNSERIGAAFVMGSLSIGRLSVIAGARYEATSTTARRYEFDENEDSEEIVVRDRSFSNSYSHFLPGAVLRFDASDQLVMRAAWTNTIGRADYDQLAGFRESVYEPTSTPDVFEGSVSEGNPLLKPYESTNIDLSLEYYTRSGGLMSIGAFRKRIDNPIYDYEVTIRDTVFEGRQYAELDWQQDRNANSGHAAGRRARLDAAARLPARARSTDWASAANAALIKSEVIGARVARTRSCRSSGRRAACSTWCLTTRMVRSRCGWRGPTAARSSTKSAVSRSRIGISTGGRRSTSARGTPCPVAATSSSSRAAT